MKGTIIQYNGTNARKVGRFPTVLYVQQRTTGHINRKIVPVHRSAPTYCVMPVQYPVCSIILYDNSTIVPCLWYFANGITIATCTGGMGMPPPFGHRDHVRTYISFFRYWTTREKNQEPPRPMNDAVTQHSVILFGFCRVGALAWFQFPSKFFLYRNDFISCTILSLLTYRSTYSGLKTALWRAIRGPSSSYCARVWHTFMKEPCQTKRTNTKYATSDGKKKWA